MKKYLLFDLDGTLTDPKVGICTCVQYALASFGIEEPDLSKLEPFIGPPLKDGFMEFYHMDAVQAEAAIEKYRERFKDKGIFENKMYRGIPRLLRELNARGMVLAVASSKPTVFVRRILEYFKIDKYFKVVVGSELDGSRTDKGQVVGEALRLLFEGGSVRTEEVYMVGDRRFDVEGAHAAHVECVGVTYGYGGMEELKGAGCDYIVRSVEELGSFLLRDARAAGREIPGRRVLGILFPLLAFLLIRSLVADIAVVAAKGGIFGDFWVVRDGEGVPVGFTGNASAVISALGFLAGGAAVFGTARRMIGEAAREGRLRHIRKEPGKHYVFAGTAGLGLAAGGNLLLALAGATDASAAYREVAGRQYSAWLGIGLVCYGIIAPVAEELVFRGIVYNGLKGGLRPAAAMAASALVFAVYHGNMVQGIYAFIMGCFMAYAYEYFGSFRIPAAIHISANLLAYLAGFGGAAAPGVVSWPVCIICFAVAAGSVGMLCRDRYIW